MVRPRISDQFTAPPLLSVPEATDAIATGRIELYTTDVFDTLVWRPVAQPHHLFLALGDRLTGEGYLADWVTPTILAEARVDAERRARADAENYECTLEEIWALIADSWWVAGASPTTGVVAELAVESELLFPQPTGVSLIERARAHGCVIKLVSDTYFSAEQLRAILNNVGIDTDGIEIVTSSDHRESKRIGLLERVVHETGIGPDRWLHVGDHLISDALTAVEAGGSACWVEVGEPGDILERADAAWEQLSAGIGSDGGRLAVVRETLLSADDLGNDPSYQFGAAVAGPALAGFAGWASRRAERLGAESIYCLLREGGRIAELMEMVRPGGPAPSPVHASRWAMMRAAVFDGTPAEIGRALAGRGAITPDRVSEAFGIPPATVARVLGGASYPQTERDAVADALADDDETRDLIVTASAALRANVVTYLRGALDLDSADVARADAPIVLCDIGWGGSIQESITEILRSIGVKRRIVGLYLLLSPAGIQRRAEGAELYAYIPSVGRLGHSIEPAQTIMRNPEFFERITTPNVGTLLEFDDAGLPHCRPETIHSPNLEAGQRGVIDFCRHLGTMATDKPDLADFWFDDGDVAETAAAAFASVITLPSPELADSLSVWEHDDVAGGAPEQLTNPAFRRWAKFLGPGDIDTVKMTEVYWVNGALHPGTNADMLLLSGNIDPSWINSSNEAGLARVALFERDSQLASDQIEVVPSLTRDGWATVLLTGTPDSLRSIRFDPGQRACLVEVADASVIVETPTARHVLADDAATFLRLGGWVSGRTVADRFAIIGDGGHYLIPIDPDGYGHIQSVDVRVAFRTRPVPDEIVAQLDPAWRRGRDRARRASAKIRARMVPPGVGRD